MQHPYQTVWKTSLLISEHSVLIQLAPQPAATAVTHPLVTTQLNWAPTHGVQVAGHQGFKLFPTPTYRKQGQKASTSLYLNYVRIPFIFYCTYL